MYKKYVYTYTYTCVQHGQFLLYIEAKEIAPKYKTAYWCRPENRYSTSPAKSHRGIIIFLCEQKDDPRLFGFFFFLSRFLHLVVML